MTSSTSGSDQLDRPQDTAQRAWRRWLVVFCGAFFGVSGLLYALLLLVDPYDVGRFPSFGITGHADRSLRTADASRGRDPNYNAAVIGNSTGQIINPFRLSQETGLKFVQLSIPATGPREQLVTLNELLAGLGTRSYAFIIAAKNRPNENCVVMMTARKISVRMTMSEPARARYSDISRARNSPV